MEAKMICCDQYKRYGDFFRVWEIKDGYKYTVKEPYCD